MATNYPTGLDSITAPAPTDLRSAVPALSTRLAQLGDAVVALETKVGVNSSAVTTSMDYLSSHEGGGYVRGDGIGICDPRLVTTAAVSGAGTLRLSGLIAPKSFTTANMTAYVASGGSGVTLLKYGLYTLDASGNGTLVASTANSQASQGSTGKVKFALQASYAVVQGTRLAMAILSVGGTAPQYGITAGLGVTTFNNGDPFVCMSLGSQTDLPASFTFASLTAQAATYYTEINT